MSIQTVLHPFAGIRSMLTSAFFNFSAALTKIACSGAVSGIFLSYCVEVGTWDLWGFNYKSTLEMDMSFLQLLANCVQRCWHFNEGNILSNFKCCSSRELREVPEFCYLLITSFGKTYKRVIVIVACKNSLSTLELKKPSNFTLPKIWTSTTFKNLLIVQHTARLCCVNFMEVQIHDVHGENHGNPFE